MNTVKSIVRNLYKQGGFVIVVLATIFLIFNVSRIESQDSTKYLLLTILAVVTVLTIFHIKSQWKPLK